MWAHLAPACLCMLELCVKIDTIWARHVAIVNIIQALFISLTGAVIHSILGLLQCLTALQQCIPFMRPVDSPESKSPHTRTFIDQKNLQKWIEMGYLENLLQFLSSRSHISVDTILFNHIVNASHRISLGTLVAVCGPLLARNNSCICFSINLKGWKLSWRTVDHFCVYCGAGNVGWLTLGEAANQNIFFQDLRIGCNSG